MQSQVNIIKLNATELILIMGTKVPNLSFTLTLICFVMLTVLIYHKTRLAKRLKKYLSTL